jgi:hypothetical protein
MEPNDYYDAPIGKVLHFIQSVELIKGMHNRSSMVAVQGPVLWPTLVYLSIYLSTTDHEARYEIIPVTPLVINCPNVPKWKQ